MAQQFESSIIIPVFNKWDLTRLCLKSLAATTERENVEIIVVDNASSDVTSKACPVLGKNLFGNSFTYIRNDQNRNFAGASNQGTLAANGEFIIFLNNDTEALPGWYAPLIDDFSRFANLAATGPVLVYPRDDIFGHTVQHLGVMITPFYRLGHLYNGISADSPLAKKRRFFQAITAACMVMPRSLFLETGMFDEQFINGFEDVDLCARLWKEGYRMTINPESRVIHYESQSAGRKDNEAANGKHLCNKSFFFLAPDWHIRLKNDSLDLSITDSLDLCPALPSSIATRLVPVANSASLEELRDLLGAYPYWERGWLALAGKLKNVPQKYLALDKAFSLLGSPQIMISYLCFAQKYGDNQNIQKALKALENFCLPENEYLKITESGYNWCEKMGLPELAAKYKRKIEGVVEYGKRREKLKEVIQVIS